MRYFITFSLFSNHALAIGSKADGIVVSSSGKVVSSQVVVPAVNVAKK